MDVTEQKSERSISEQDPWKEGESKTVRAKALFSYCDIENKGSITLNDMRRLCDVVSINKEQVEQVFYSMDKDKNGEIRVKEFMSGLGAVTEVSSSPDNRRFKKGLHSNGRSLSPIHENISDPYEEFVDQTSHRDLLKTCDERLRKIFDDVKVENPSLVPVFEQLITKVMYEFEISHAKQNRLEISLQRCDDVQDEQLEQLFENLERQLEEEKSKTIVKEKSKSDKIHRRLQEELQMKERLVEEITSQQAEMEKKISQLISEEKERKKKNKILLKERNELERKLASAETMLGEIEKEMKEITEDAMETRKRRERSVSLLSREISLEEELMAAQVEKLRKHNKLLLDEYDTKTFPDSSHDHNGSRTGEMNVFNSGDGSEVLGTFEKVDRRENIFSLYLPNKEIIPLQMESMPPLNNNPEVCQQDSSDSSSISSVLENIKIFDDYENPVPPLSKATWKVTCTLLPQGTSEKKAFWKVKLKVVPLREKVIIYPQVVDNNVHQFTSADVCDGITTPERIFKIIFVGDSGVGKTSFIHRFCNDSFKTNFRTTIGIDFQVKSLIVNNRCISLQLWDTAGQERFRSISKQYFRKSDAVIIMYDVTSEESFKNVRQWMEYIQDNTDDGALILLLGNKVDARRTTQYFIVSTSHGAKLAKEYGALFFETSAKSGSNINEAMIELSSLLQEKEDTEMDKALVLAETSQKKKWRC